MPSEAARAELLAAAKAGFGSMIIVDQMQPGDGAPKGWANAAVASVREPGGAAHRPAGDHQIHGSDQGEGAAASPTGARAGGTNGTPAAQGGGDHHAKQIRIGCGVAGGRQDRSCGPTGDPNATTRRCSTTGRSFAAYRSAPPAPPPIEGPAVVRARACETQLATLARAGQILFRLASAELDRVSFPTLDKLAEAAKSCPGMSIEVGGHTSAEGSADLNQQLSLKRAQSVVAYLVHAGVDATQLEPVGYGASRPVAPNDSRREHGKEPAHRIHRSAEVARPRARQGPGANGLSG